MEGLGRAVLGGLALCLERALMPTFLSICDGREPSLPEEEQHSARAGVFGFYANEMTGMRLRLLKPICVLGCNNVTLVAPSA